MSVRIRLAGRCGDQFARRAGLLDEDLFAYVEDVDWSLRIREAGFDGVDRSLLTLLLQKFDGGPVGLDTLAAALGEDRGTLEDLVEPFLIQGGYLDRTPRGRVATRLAWDHFGLVRREPRLL